MHKHSKSLYTFFVKKDPDLDILMRTIEFSLPAFICLIIWITYRPSFATLLFPSIPGFMAIAAHMERKWTMKLKTMFLLVLGTAIAQLGCSIFFYEKFLLLCWIFFFTFTVMFCYKFMYSASASVGWGMLAIFYTPGYWAGVNRSINLFIGFIIAILSLGFLSVITCKYRIRLILCRYITSIISIQNMVFIEKTTNEQVKKTRNHLYQLAMKGDILIIFNEYILFSQNMFALRAKSILLSLHSLSRVYTLYQYIEDLNSKQQYKFYKIFNEILLSILNDIKHKRRIKIPFNILNNQLSPIINNLAKPKNQKTVFVLETMIKAISELNGKKLN